MAGTTMWNFYERFAAAMNKPFVAGETAAYWKLDSPHAELDVSDYGGVSCSTLPLRSGLLCLKVCFGSVRIRKRTLKNQMQDPKYRYSLNVMWQKNPYCQS